MGSYEREVESLEEDLELGLISSKEFNREMRELENQRMADAMERAQQAYDEEMERW